MPGSIRISTDLVQTRRVGFVCRVFITGGLAQDTVDIRLWQTAGVAPLFQRVEQTQLDAAGDGIAHFDVSLEGPCVARLVADDDNAALPLNADDIHITVLP
jgi:hypothetical protein